jgi:nucleoside-diphosphate-sugar epimerase
MRILLTGADGYIGAIMGPKLLEAGHDVIGLDTGFYRRGWLFDDRRTRPKVVSKDLREVTVDDLAGSMPWCISRSSRTTRSARTTRA